MFVVAGLDPATHPLRKRALRRAMIRGVSPRMTPVSMKPSFRGASETSEPEIHRAAGLGGGMDSGFAPDGAPRNDEEGYDARNDGCGNALETIFRTATYVTFTTLLTSNGLSAAISLKLRPANRNWRDKASRPIPTGAF